MKTNKSFITPIIIGVIILGLIIFTPKGLFGINESEKIKVGNVAPNFTLENLDGEEVALSDFKGKTVIINFWTTWCGFCDKEMPDFQKLIKADEDVVVLAVNVNESRNTVKKYIEKGGYDFTVVLDKKGDISDKYMAIGFPTSYFIDSKGIIRGAVSGKMDYPQMRQIVSEIK